MCVVKGRREDKAGWFPPMIKGRNLMASGKRERGLQSLAASVRCERGLRKSGKKSVKNSSHLCTAIAAVLCWQADRLGNTALRYRYAHRRSPRRWATTSAGLGLERCCHSARIWSLLAPSSTSTPVQHHLARWRGQLLRASPKTEWVFCLCRVRMPLKRASDCRRRQAL